MNSLIVGYGRAGRDLHHRCLLKAKESEEYGELFSKIGVVEPNGCRTIDGSASFAALKDAVEFDPVETVVHICTPPNLRLSLLREAIDIGYRNFLVEKPMALTVAEAEQVAALESERSVKIVVVSHWLSGRLVRRLKSEIKESRLGRLLAVITTQDKPRFSKTLINSSHNTAFDVELPHQIALSLFLAGPGWRVLAAHCSNMTVDRRILPFMGSASMSVLHDNGVTSISTSDLMAPVRKRTVSAIFERGGALLHLPTSSEDNYSSLRLFGESGVLECEDCCIDDPLSTAFGEYYSYFTGACDGVESSVSLHCGVIELIASAKSSCGLLYGAAPRAPAMPKIQTFSIVEQLRLRGQSRLARPRRGPASVTSISAGGLQVESSIF